MWMSENQERIEAEARAARVQYLEYGSNPPLGHIPLLDMQTMITAATEPRARLRPEEMHDVGWLCLETAVAQVYGPVHNSMSKERSAQYDPLDLIDRAGAYWTNIADNPRNDVLLRSQAHWALVAARPYAAFVGFSSIDVPDYYNGSIDASEILFKSYQRFGDQSYLHDLQVQTAMLLFNRHVFIGEAPRIENYRPREIPEPALMLPTPTRFQMDGSRALDAFLWIRGGDDEDPQTYGVKLSHHEGGIRNAINLWPKLFGNTAWTAPKARGQTTLQAIIDETRGRDRWLDERRRHHLIGVGKRIWGVIQEQRTGVRPIFEADPLSGLEAAEAWYKGLPPNYRLGPLDVANLERCLNPFEYQFGRMLDKQLVNPNKADALTLHMFGWICMEMGDAGQAGSFDRAEQAFELAALTADREGQWALYCEALADAAGARFARDSCNPETAETAPMVYWRELADLGQRLMSGLATIDEEAPQYSQIRTIAERLAACMAVISGQDYAAVLLSPRERGVYSQSRGSDMLIVPPGSDGVYKLAVGGRVRFQEQPDDSALEEGVAIVTFSDMYGSGERDVLALLHSVINASPPESDDQEPSQEWIFTNYFRDKLISTAEIFMQ